MGFFIKITTLFTLLTLGLVGRAEEDSNEVTVLSTIGINANVYFCIDEPFIIRDSLVFDESEVQYLGTGNFRRITDMPSWIMMERGNFVIEYPGYGISVFRAEDYYLPKDRIFRLDMQEKDLEAKGSGYLPLSVEMGEVEVHLEDDTNPLLTYNEIDANYHRGFTFDKSLGKRDSEFFHEYISDQLELSIIEKTRGPKKEEKYNVIPELYLNCVVHQSVDYNYAMGYYSYNQTSAEVKYAVNLQLVDENDSLVKEMDFVEEFMFDGTVNADVVYRKNRFWFLKGMKEFFNTINPDDIQYKYQNDIKLAKSKWDNINLKTPKEISLQQSVVTIVSSDGHGSGVILSEDGYIITNCHVVGQDDIVEVLTYSGDTLLAIIVRKNLLHDLAIIQVEDIKLSHPAKINFGAIQPLGAEVTCIGSPFDKRLFGSVSKGIISAVYKKNGVYRYALSAAVNPGNSGGALFDKNGELIGIIYAKIVGYSYQNIGFAVPTTSFPKELNLLYNK